MTLACGFYSEPSFDLTQSLLWSVALLAPVAAFVAAPRMLPLGRELRWTFARMMLPLAWLMSRAAGDPAEASGWFGRARMAWRREVEAHHAGRATEPAASDGVLLGRARLAGWLAGATVTFAALSTAGLLAAGETEYRGRLLLCLAIALLPAAWLARVGAEGAALYAQSRAIGRGAMVRTVVGAAVGVALGAITGFTAGFLSLVAFVPSMSLATLSAPTSHQTMDLFTYGGLAAAAFGALFGMLLLGGLALFAPRAEAPASGE